MTSQVAVRAHVHAWVQQERARYADVKNAEDTDIRTVVRQAISSLDMETALNMPLNYLKRAELFGLDSPQGRQALGKAVVTLTHYLETAVEYHGDMPQPGHPTNTIMPWDDCPVPVDRSDSPPT